MGTYSLIENPPEGNIEYTDLGLTSNKRYYYQVRILKDEVLHPGSNKLSLMVR